MKKREITKLFGNRVALQLIEEEYEGLLVRAPSENQIHVISRVVAIGDLVKQDIKIEDILFWQTNKQIEHFCRYNLDGVPVFVLMMGDMVARLKSRVIKQDTFQVIGDWCLVRRVIEQPSKRIVVPDQAVEANQDMVVRYHLAQKGETVEAQIEIDQEVMVDRSRANPIQLGEEKFCYIHKNYVIGTVG